MLGHRNHQPGVLLGLVVGAELEFNTVTNLGGNGISDLFRLGRHDVADSVHGCQSLLAGGADGIHIRVAGILQKVDADPRFSGIEFIHRNGLQLSKALRFRNPVDGPLDLGNRFGNMPDAGISQIPRPIKTCFQGGDIGAFTGSFFHKRASLSEF